MDDKQYIRLLLNKSIDIHNRFNNSIEEIVRKGHGEQQVRDLIESLRYVTDEIERIINR